MKKHRAAMALHTRPLIVGELHHNIVETITALHGFMRGCIGNADKPVVVPVTNGFAPAIMRAKGAGWEPGTGRKYPICPIEQAPQPPDAARTGAIPLPLAKPPAGAAQRTSDPKRPNGKPARGGSVAQAEQPDGPYGRSGHAAAFTFILKRPCVSLTFPIMSTSNFKYFRIGAQS